MKRTSLFTAGTTGGLAAVVMIALNYIGARLAGLPFMPFDIFDWMTRHLPGALINFVIASMVKAITALSLGPTASTAKLVEQSIGLVQFVLAGVIVGVILGMVERRAPEQLSSAGIIVGLAMSALMIYIEITYRFPAAGPLASSLWLILVFTGSGAIIARLVREIASPEMVSAPQPELAPVVQNEGPTTIVKPVTRQEMRHSVQPGLSRRQFLYLVGAGSFTVLVGATGLRLSQQSENLPATGAVVPTAVVPTEDLSQMDSNSGPAASPAQSVLDARFKPVNGTRPELTPNDQFYRIDINAEPPIVDGTTWRLELGGLVGTPLSLALSEIQSMPSITQAVTMSCISNELGGDLIGTSLWTGVPFKDILAKAGLKPGVKAINISAADGFYESVPIEEAMDGHTMLVYQMGGAPLTPDHGYPLRIYIPNHFGMKQPKWITKMEAADSLGRGYWVDRGWSTTAYAQTTSVVDVVAVDELDQQTGMVPVGGIAWAGSRGISKVELKVDSGDWQSAELRNPPLSPLTWVQWRYFWKATPGYHTFSVRAYDGTGALQVTDSHPTFPDGATGIVEVAAQLPK